jgi:hypothetical protein
LYTDDYNIVQRNLTRSNELPKSWIDEVFTQYQNEFYEIIAKKMPNSRSISTTGKDKAYVSKIISRILDVQEFMDR